MILSPYLADVLGALVERSRSAPPLLPRVPSLPAVRVSADVRIVDGRAYAARTVTRVEAQQHDPVGLERWR